MKPQDAFTKQKIHSTSTIATSNVVFLSVELKDLEGTLNYKDMEVLCKHVDMTINWREQRIKKAMQVMMTANASSITPSSEEVPVLRRSSMQSQAKKIPKLSNIPTDGMLPVHNQYT